MVHGEVSTQCVQFQSCIYRYAQRACLKMSMLWTLPVTLLQLLAAQHQTQTSIGPQPSQLFQPGLNLYGTIDSLYGGALASHPSQHAQPSSTAQAANQLQCTNSSIRLLGAAISGVCDMIRTVLLVAQGVQVRRCAASACARSFLPGSSNAFGASSTAPAQLRRCVSRVSPPG